MSAAVGVSPWRMNSTIRNDAHVLMLASPRPVLPAAPTWLSQYWPAPITGESPMRPGTFHAMPLVVVTEPISPAAFTAFMLIVPVVNLILMSSSWLSHASLAFSRDFQRIQSWRDCSVSRFCSLNPMALANFVAPAPTSMT